MRHYAWFHLICLSVSLLDIEPGGWSARFWACLCLFIGWIRKYQPDCVLHPPGLLTSTFSDLANKTSFTRSAFSISNHNSILLGVVDRTEAALLLYSSEATTRGHKGAACCLWWAFTFIKWKQFWFLKNLLTLKQNEEKDNICIQRSNTLY